MRIEALEVGDLFCKHVHINEGVLKICDTLLGKHFVTVPHMKVETHKFEPFQCSGV